MKACMRLYVTKQVGLDSFNDRLSKLLLSQSEKQKVTAEQPLAQARYCHCDNNVGDRLRSPVSPVRVIFFLLRIAALHMRDAIISRVC